MPFRLIPPRVGYSPFWRVRGTEYGIYTNKSTKASERKIAQRILTEWRAEAQRQAINGTKPHKTTFAEAAISYMESGGERRFLAPLLKRIGNLSIENIGQTEIDAAAVTLYPSGTPSTRNRQVYSPVSAILKHAGMERPFDAAEAVDVRFGALCAFLLYTGCRLSEALRLRWQDVNLEESFAYVRDTKNGDPRGVHLTVATVAAISNVPKNKSTVFSLSKCGRLYKMLDMASVASGVGIPERIAFHIFRHSYAAWMRRYSGLDTTGLVATGAWRSRQAASVYEHAVTTEEARKADLLPTRSGK